MSNPQTAPFYLGLNTPGILPDQNVSRTGYREAELAGYKAESFKTTGAVYYNLTEKVQAIAEATWGKGSTMYTGSDRYSLSNFSIGQYKLELKGEQFFIRGYTTRERSGESYVTSILGSYLNESAKPSQQWFPEYIGNFIGARLKTGVSEEEAHAAARAAADQGRLIPGSPEFQSAKEAIQSNTISSGKGARFNDKTNLYHYEGFYDLTRTLHNTVELQVGSSYRIYQLRSAGTIFDDLNRILNTSELGAYAVAGKRFFGDRLKLTLAGRYDKNENFEGRFTPRITSVYRISPGHHLRMSYQTGYRNPTNQNQYLDLAAGGGSFRMIGGLPEMLNKYDLYNNKPFTNGSYQRFQASASAGSPDPTLLRTYDFDRRGVLPESVHAFEIGDKVLITPDLLLDTYIYYSVYHNFISETSVYQRKGDIFTAYNV
ncbi:MAG: TonB-dependent receptor, partial [Cytophagaceae bacterium]